MGSEWGRVNVACGTVHIDYITETNVHVIYRTSILTYMSTILTLNPYSAEPVLEITLVFTCSNMGALIYNCLLDEASTMNRQDSHLQFEPKRNNLRS
jgi:hypothetical protein